MKIAVVGGGWFGCHITKVLQQSTQHEVYLFEQNNSLLSNASRYNQNRLHLGFHYPRNKSTRKLCYSNFEKFQEQYSYCLESEPLNIYSVSYNSIVDFETYVDIMKSSGLDYVVDDYHVDYFNPNTIDGSVSTNEKIINFGKAKEYFTNTLNNVILNYKFTEKDSCKFDKVIYCTYYPIDELFLCKYVPTLIWKVKLDWNISFTVMNGHFFSLLRAPSNQSHTHTLTHVKHGRLGDYQTYDLAKESINDINIKTATDSLMEDIKKYFKLEYYDQILSNLDTIPEYCIKTIIPSSSDGRDLYTIKNINNMFITCGKISGIFDAEQEVLQWIN